MKVELSVCHETYCCLVFFFWKYLLLGTNYYIRYVHYLCYVITTACYYLHPYQFAFTLRAGKEMYQNKIYLKRYIKKKEYIKFVKVCMLHVDLLVRGEIHVDFHDLVNVLTT
jgi:hypothetical protein